MHDNVSNRNAWKIMTLVLSPMFPAIEGSPQTELRAQEQQTWRYRVFLDDVRVATHTAVGCNDGRPGLPIVRRFVNVRLHVSECVPVESRIRGGGIIETRFHPRDPGILG